MTPTSFSPGEVIAIVSFVSGTFFTVLGYFIHRLIEGTDEKIADLKAQQNANNESLSESIDKIKYEIGKLHTTVHATGISVTFIQKKVEEIEKINESLTKLSGRLVATETKIDNFGKIIYRNMPRS